jgi:nucleoid DNA-binding protein
VIVWAGRRIQLVLVAVCVFTSRIARLTRVSKSSIRYKETRMSTDKRLSKSQIISELSDKTGVSKKDVQTLLSELLTLVERELGEKGPGEFLVPDLVKFKVKEVPAKAAHTGLDPFTKQEREFPAKPASRKVRATPGSRLKKLGA